LASGKQAKYYLDCREVTLDAQGARLVGEGMLELLAGNMPDLVGGMAIGADPITAAILTLAGVRDIPLRGVMVRKEAKQHGTGKFVEGPFRAGESLVVVEDVVTTGGSSLLAIERCEAVGLKVRRVLAIIDRLEGGREAFAARGYELTTLFTVREFGIV
jgi:orotate phosphoribosyltransferase